MNGTRTGVVLAGGYSIRFGEREKALAELAGQPLLVHAVNGVTPAVDNVVVNCRRDQLPSFRDALAPVLDDVAFVCDSEPDEGPAAGLATALDAVAASRVAVVACDMPYVDATFLEWLFEVMDEADGAVPYVKGAPQPVHAVFVTEPARRAAYDALTNASGSLRDVLDQLDIVEISEARVFEKTVEASFVDVNTPSELRTITSKSGPHERIKSTGDEMR